MKKSILSIYVAIAAIFLVSCTKDPVACFDATSDSLDENNDPLVGEKISFENCSEEADSYLWDFGDGETSTKQNPSHVYDEGGEYTVTLEATNKKGTTTSDFDIDVVSLTGEWSGIMELDGEVYGIIFDIEQDGDELAGNFVFEDGSGSGTLINSEISGNEVSIVASIYEDGYYYDFTFVGEVNPDFDEMEGLYYYAEIEMGEWYAEKSSSKSVNIKSNIEYSGKNNFINALKGKMK